VVIEKLLQRGGITSLYRYHERWNGGQGGKFNSMALSVSLPVQEDPNFQRRMLPLKHRGRNSGSRMEETRRTNAGSVTSII
jgi:hypothetical protein